MSAVTAVVSVNPDGMPEVTAVVSAIPESMSEVTTVAPNYYEGMKETASLRSQFVLHALLKCFLILLSSSSKNVSTDTALHSSAAS